eukprot:3978920-Alexandrium_andersonii.AAC.1
MSPLSSWSSASCLTFSADRLSSQLSVSLTPPIARLAVAVLGAAPPAPLSQRAAGGAAAGLQATLGL